MTSNPRSLSPKKKRDRIILLGSTSISFRIPHVERSKRMFSLSMEWTMGIEIRIDPLSIDPFRTQQKGWERKGIHDPFQNETSKGRKKKGWLFFFYAYIGRTTGKRKESKFRSIRSHDLDPRERRQKRSRGCMLLVRAQLSKHARARSEAKRAHEDRSERS